MAGKTGGGTTINLGSGSKRKKRGGSDSDDLVPLGAGPKRKKGGGSDSDDLVAFTPSVEAAVSEQFATGPLTLRSKARALRAAAELRLEAAELAARKAASARRRAAEAGTPYVAPEVPREPRKPLSYTPSKRAPDAFTKADRRRLRKAQLLAEIEALESRGPAGLKSVRNRAKLFRKDTAAQIKEQRRAFESSRKRARTAYFDDVRVAKEMAREAEDKAAIFEAEARFGKDSEGYQKVLDRIEKRKVKEAERAEKKAEKMKEKAQKREQPDSESKQQQKQLQKLREKLAKLTDV